MHRRQIAIGITALVVVVIVLITVVRLRRHRSAPLVIQGAIVAYSPETEKRSPIEDVEVDATNGVAVRATTSDFSGFFQLTLGADVEPGQSIVLTFRHPDYLPVNMTAVVLQ